jgi:hypothetical protein
VIKRAKWRSAPRQVGAIEHATEREARTLDDSRRVAIVAHPRPPSHIIELVVSSRHDGNERMTADRRSRPE